MILQDLQEYHHTQQERKTSEVIRVLTVISSVFIPLTFLVGLWGMNFRFMPRSTPSGARSTLPISIAPRHHVVLVATAPSPSG
jgi:Mg2+ and Co2+ transporter CorA